MSKAAHTAGPWEFVKQRDGSYRIFAPVGFGPIVADVFNRANPEANARLIAAAPELLAALEGAICHFDRHDDEPAWIVAAIAKVTGVA